MPNPSGKKRLGLTLKISADGTLTLPPGKLQSAGLQPGAEVEILATPAEVIIRPIDAVCDLCGAPGEVLTLRNRKRLCRTCLGTAVQALFDSGGGLNG